MLANGVCGAAYRLSKSLFVFMYRGAWATVVPWGRQARRVMLKGEFLFRILGEERVGGD